MATLQARELRRRQSRMCEAVTPFSIETVSRPMSIKPTIELKKSKDSRDIEEGSPPRVEPWKCSLCFLLHPVDSAQSAGLGPAHIWTSLPYDPSIHYQQFDAGTCIVRTWRTPRSRDPPSDHPVQKPSGRLGERSHMQTQLPYKSKIYGVIRLSKSVCEPGET